MSKEKRFLFLSNQCVNVWAWDESLKPSPLACDPDKHLESSASTCRTLCQSRFTPTSLGIPFRALQGALNTLWTQPACSSALAWGPRPTRLFYTSSDTRPVPCCWGSNLCSMCPLSALSISSRNPPRISWDFICSPTALLA